MNRDDRVERFERDLTDVLREIAGEEAPMSLRYRLSDITERAPIGRRLWFATPMRLSVVAVTAVAVLALAVLFWPRTEVGPVPSDSAEPSPTQSVEPSPSPSDEPTPSAAPTVAPTPMPTVAPTIAPTRAPTTPATGEWTGLVWSDPVTPSFTVHLYDLVPWGDGYVAVGDALIADGVRDGAFFTSSDGRTWTITHRDSGGSRRVPHHLVVLGDELFAFSRMEWNLMDRVPPDGWLDHRIWRSEDGVDWSIVESDSWTDAWDGLQVDDVPAGWDRTTHGIDTGLVDAAATADGIVVIGNSYAGDGMSAVLLFSPDGRNWTVANLPAGSDSALLNAVVQSDGRYVITGAVDVGPDPMATRAAAWYSDDGRTWLRASVESGPDGIELDAGTEFGPIWAGADGLLTCRGNRELAAGGWRYMMEWLSTDGTRWQLATDLDGNPGCDWSASDGTRIVSLGPRAAFTPWPGVTGAWTSTDGGQWQSVELGSILTDRLEQFWVVPDGVIYAGHRSFWFGTPVIAP